MSKTTKIVIAVLVIAAIVIGVYVYRKKKAASVTKPTTPTVPATGAGTSNLKPGGLTT